MKDGRIKPQKVSNNAPSKQNNVVKKSDNREEKKIIISEPIVKDISIADFSLEALREISPVNFKGKEIKDKEDGNKNQSSSSNLNGSQEIELKEGEDVAFDN